MTSANATRAATLAEAAHHADCAVPVSDRVHAAWVHPADLAAIVACAHFHLLSTICRLLRKVLVVRHD